MNTARNLVATKSANPQWGPLLELAGREVFELMLGTPVSAPPEDTPTEIDITAMVGLAGQLCGVMSVRCKRETAAKMAGKMLGSEPLPDSQEVQDAFGEIGNMIAGNFKHKITGAAGNCMLSVPTVISGSDFSVHSLADADAYEVTLLFEGKPFVITLEIHS
jgi:chemotaxis protein CheX